MTLTAGSKFGPYEDVDRLGACGMGEVSVDRDNKLRSGMSLAVRSETPTPHSAAQACSPTRGTRGSRAHRPAGREFQWQIVLVSSTLQSPQPRRYCFLVTGEPEGIAPLQGEQLR